MATIQQEINAAFKNAYNRNATQGELDYYARVGTTKLRDNLRADPKAGGVYKAWRDSQAGKAAPSTPNAVGSANYEKDLTHIGDATKQKTMAGWGYKWTWTNKAKNEGTYAPSTAAAKAKYKSLYGKEFSLPSAKPATPTTPISTVKKPTAIVPAQMPEPLKELLGTVQQQLDQLVEQGKQPLPDIEITPEVTAQFLQQATTELEPYYQRLANDAIADLKTSLQNVVTKQGQTESDYARQYGELFDQTAAQAAEMGLTLSGRRQKTERELADEANRNIGRSREDLAYNVGQTATTAQRYLGSDLFATGVGQFSLGARPTFTAGNREAGMGSNDSLYQLSPGIESELERQKTVAVQQRKSELESAERARRMLLLQ